MKAFQSKTIQALSGLVISLYVVSSSLRFGGRWDLQSQLSAGIKLLKGDWSAYLIGESNSFDLVNVYPFGQSLIIGLLGRVFGFNAGEWISLFILAPILVILLFLVCGRIGAILSDVGHTKGGRGYLVATACSLSILMTYKFYIFYAAELKPDSLSIILFLMGVILIIRKKRLAFKGADLTDLLVFVCWFAASSV